MTARMPRTLFAAAVIVALGFLVLAGKTHAAADTGTFQFQEPFFLPVDFTDTCLGPGATGTVIGGSTVVGGFTENGPPTFEFHSRATITTDFQLDLADGRSVVGTFITHESANGAPAITQTDASHGSATLYDPADQSLGPLTIRAISHVTWRDLNDNHQPDPDEFSANVNQIGLTCG
jgi:hypothetical protein